MESLAPRRTSGDARGGSSSPSAVSMQEPVPPNLHLDLCDSPRAIPAVRGEWPANASGGRDVASTLDPASRSAGAAESSPPMPTVSVAHVQEAGVDGLLSHNPRRDRSRTFSAATRAPSLQNNPHADATTLNSPKPSMNQPPSQRKPRVGEAIRRINSPRPVVPHDITDESKEQASENIVSKIAGNAECASKLEQESREISIDAVICKNKEKESPEAGINNTDSSQASHQNKVIPPGVAIPAESTQWNPVPWSNLKRPRGGTWKFSYPLLTSVAPDPEQCPCRMRGTSVASASSPPSQSPTEKKRARGGCEKMVVYDWHDPIDGENMKVAGKDVSRSILPIHPDSPSPQRFEDGGIDSVSPSSSIGSPFRVTVPNNNLEDLNLLAEASSSMFSPSSEEKRNADSDNEPSGDDSDGDGDTVASMRPVKLIDSKDKEFEEKEELQQSDHVEAAKENESAYSEQQEELSRRRRREKLRSLCFDSHFESGNLLRAVKVGPYEYDLYIRPDINTTGFQQWWYFSLCNTHPPGWERQLENVRLARKNVLQMPAKHDASLDAAAELGMPASALDINHPPEDEAERDLRVLGKGPNGTGLDWTGAMTYRFNIVNLCKPDSMYNRGMQPVMYSCRDAEGRGIGWRRTGRDICYFANDLLRGGDNANGQHHYTLTFKVSFGLPENVYLLAHSIPYTWTDNLRHIDALLTLRPHCVRRSILCHTLAGRQCDVLTITDFDTGELINGTKEATKDHFLECGLASDPVNSTSSASRGGSRSSEDFSSSSTGRGGWLNNNGRSGSGIYSGSSSAANKGSSGTSHGSSSVGDVEDADGLGNTHTRRVIVMTARVHPGESPASWITKGFIDFITSKAPAAQLLRRMFVFKIVPMINPDGVFYGNNRCSLAGVDLNRQWQKPTPHMHPTIHNSKAMIRHLHGTRECALYVDMHAHSRKGNVFMYGVEEKNRMKPTVRLFPALLDKSPFADTLFSFKDCTFNVGRGRESTARVVVARELMVKHSYTVESSYCGPDEGPLARTQFNTRHLEMVGVGMADTLLQIYHPSSAMRRYAQQELGDISLRIRGDKRAKRLLARAQEKRRIAAAERYSAWAHRDKDEQKWVRLGKVPESALGNTFSNTRSFPSSSTASNPRISSDDWGKTVVEGFSAIVQDGVRLKLPTGLITPEWYKQLGMGVGLFWKHKKKRRHKASSTESKTKLDTKANTSELAACSANDRKSSASSAHNGAVPVPPSSNPSSPFISVGVGGAQTNRSMRKLSHMMFGGERSGGGSHNGHAQNGGRRLSSTARGQKRLRAAAALATATAASNATTESGYVPYTHFGFLSKQISMMRAKAEASNASSTTERDTNAEDLSCIGPPASSVPCKGNLSRSKEQASMLFDNSKESHQRRIIRTAGARTRKKETKVETHRSTHSPSATAQTNRNSINNSTTDHNKMTSIPHRPAENGCSLQNAVIELNSDHNSYQLEYISSPKVQPFFAGGSPNGRSKIKRGGGSNDSPSSEQHRGLDVEVVSGSDHAPKGSTHMSHRRIRADYDHTKASQNVGAAHAKAKANLGKAAAAATLAARRSEKHRNSKDSLNPKLLYASMPPRARRAIERRLNSMLSNSIVSQSSGSNVSTGEDDRTADGDRVGGMRQQSMHNKVQKTSRGRITGTVLAKSSGKPPSSVNANVNSAIIVETSNGNTAKVRKKRSRRMRVKHRRSGGRKGKKKNRHAHDKDAKSNHGTSARNNSNIHTRADYPSSTSAPGPRSHPSIEKALHADYTTSSTTAGAALQGSYAAAYLRQSTSVESTSDISAKLVKSFVHGQGSFSPRPGASKNVSSFLSSNQSPGRPHPPGHQANGACDAAWVATNSGGSKTGIPGRPLAMNTYSGGSAHHRAVHSPHRQYRASNAPVTVMTAPHERGFENIKRDAAALSRYEGEQVEYRPNSSSGSRDRGIESSRITHVRKFSHSSAVGSAAAAAAARRGGHRLSSKRFLPNLEGTGSIIDRERWGLAFSPITKSEGRS